MARMTTLPQAVSALNAVGVSVNNLEGEVRPVSEVIDELGRKWHTLSDAERQNTAVRVAGVYQLTR